MGKGQGIRHCGNCGKSGHYAKTCRDVNSHSTIGTPMARAVGVSGSASVSKTEGGGSIPPRPATINDGPLIVKGEVVVDAERYPHLHAALTRGKALMDGQDADWKRVTELRKQGQDGAADRLIRKMLGVAEPMSEEAKAKLREYYEKNKEAIQERQKAKREVRRRTLEILDQRSEKLTRKRGG